MPEKILIVDDSATDRLIIESMLSDYEIATACDGLEAMRQIETDAEISIVILDLHMPNMDGFQVLEALKATYRHKTLRAIILTNYDEPENEIKGLKLGAVDYIRKPINMQSLRVRIEIHLKLMRMQRLLEEELFKNRLTLDAVFQQAPIGIAISHNREPSDNFMPDIVSINPCFERITGRTKEELVRLGWERITHPEDLEKDRYLFNRLQAGEIGGYSMEKRYIRPDGSEVWVNMIVAPLRLNNDYRYNHICLVQDITERKAMEKALRESEQSKAVLLDNLPGMTYRCKFDRDWTMLYVSNGCLELTGYSPESLLCNRDVAFNDLIAPEYREELWEKWVQAVDAHLKLKVEYEIVTASGTKKWVWEQGQAVYGEDGSPLALEGLIIDITDRKNYELKLKYLSEHDPMTGLKNLRCFEEAYTNCKNSGIQARCALVMVNIRRFSVINKLFGHRYGDGLIREVAACLLKAVSDPDLLFHLSVDRFAIYIPSYEDKSDLVGICDRIISVLEAEISQKTVGFSIGVVEIDKYTACDTEELLKRAYAAADYSNKLERFGFCFFSGEMEEKQKREIAVRQALNETLHKEEDGSLYMLYQPIISLKTGKIVSFEALARYKSEELGQISPAEFIPVAESSLIIIPLGQKIMRLAFKFALRLAREGYKSVSLSINISPIQLLGETFLPDLEKLLDETGLDPRSLNIEITESVFSENLKEINDKLDKISSMGIQIAIDDFGTGYSSFARERDLKVNCLKIDKSFIAKLLEINCEKAITGDVISMAHKLGHSVVAEGVEQEKQRIYLMEHGCDMMQGYLFSRPVDEEAALELLRKMNGSE